MNKKCVVRRLSIHDLSMILEWRNHPDVRRFMFTQHIIEQVEHQKWFLRAETNSNLHMLLVEDAGVPLGFVQFNPVESGGISDWGFYARPGAPKGTGVRLGRAALDYAFGLHGLHKVCGQAINTNAASIAMHGKLGFRQEGILREQHSVHGEYHSVVCFGLLASEWQNGRNVE